MRHKSKDPFFHLTKVCKDKLQRDRSCWWRQCCRNVTVQVKLQKLMGTCMKNNATPREVGPLKVIIRHAAHFQWLATHPGHFLCSPNMASQAKYKMSFWLFLGCHPARAPHVHTFQIPSWLDAESFPGPVLPGHSGQGGSSMGSLCKRPGSYQPPLVTGCLISLCHSTLRPREASLLFQLCLY